MTEVICRQIVTTGADINAVMAFALIAIGCGVALCALSPQIGHWVALHLAAHSEGMAAGREARYRKRREFISENTPGGQE